ncbi:MAG: endonuclease III [Draconibacterium sp.]|nr:MAG: endonuclease III [Draconibacterium sp.]PIF06478.1 MAG: endonuclease III [Draconibacterium sp.]
MKKRALFDYVINYFGEKMPVAETELHYQNPFHLIVAVILSAQCTDKRVNQITPDLLKRFPTPEKMAAAEPAEVYDYIKTCSYPNNKAKHLVGMSRKLLELFDGKIPAEVDALQKLPGVGRKTANVIASVIFNQPAMAVDTHVFRVAARIGLTTGAKTPLATELQLVKYIPEDLIPKAHHWLILHGRYVCMARKPKCDLCGLHTVCRYFEDQQKIKK